MCLCSLPLFLLSFLNFFFVEFILKLLNFLKLFFSLIFILHFFQLDRIFECKVRLYFCLQNLFSDYVFFLFLFFKLLFCALQHLFFNIFGSFNVLLFLQFPFMKLLFQLASHLLLFLDFVIFFLLDFLFVNKVLILGNFTPHILTNV